MEDEDGENLSPIHSMKGRNSDKNEFRAILNEMQESERLRLDKRRKKQEASLPSSFHEVELGNWEKMINWDGCAKGMINTKQTNLDNSGTPDISMQCDDDSSSKILEDSQALLSHPVNPALESMDFSKFISWDGCMAPKSYNLKLSKQMSRLILEGSVAAQSVANTSNALPIHAHRPKPFAQSSVVLQRDYIAQNPGSSGNAMMQSNSLQPDKEQRERYIAERQRKRAQMAIDKTKRITDAINDLDMMGPGQGRTITSSLMGPGGTERTGRPTRRGGNSSLAHDAEYVEQLDMLNNHVLVKADRKINDLRTLFRPRLPGSAFRRNEVMPWQLQIRIFPSAINNKKLGKRKTSNLASGTLAADGSTVIGSYQGGIAASTPGAISQAKIKNEADLSPTEGDLVMFEYCEEKPPLHLSKGMAVRIVNYFRGDKTKCPISAGGGDRPARKKRHGAAAADVDGDGEKGGIGISGKVEKPPRLIGMGHIDSQTISSSLIGNLSKSKTKEGDNGISSNSRDSGQGGKKEKKKESAITIIPEGVTEILYKNVHGPFIGEVEEHETQTGLISNLFAAPMYLHKPRSTDFLIILGKRPSHSMSTGMKLPVVIRPLPTSVFCVGQTEPRVKVPTPNTTSEKTFLTPFVTYQIAKALQRAQATKNQGLRFDEINDRLFANTDIQQNALRQRIKQVAQYDKNTQIWTLKEIGEENFQGVDVLGRKFSPEGVAAYESSLVAARRLSDLGIRHLVSGSVTAILQAFTVLTQQMKAAKDRDKIMAKNLKNFRAAIGGSGTNTSIIKSSSGSTSGKGNHNLHFARHLALYERAARKLDAVYKDIKYKSDLARFIYEELELAPWHLTTEFIDVHKNDQGTGMMQLTGLGDPSGDNGGYNFVRVFDAKPANNTDGALNAQIKKITGTDKDLRKLNMKQMASMLRSYGLDQKVIDKLKRWDRVHLIRDLCTKQASDGTGDGLERYARGEKMKLSDQKNIYRERIQEIWRRQRTALIKSYDLSGIGGNGVSVGVASTETGSTKDSSMLNANGGGVGGLNESIINDETIGDPSPDNYDAVKATNADDSSDYDDLEDEFENNYESNVQGNQIIARQFKDNSVNDRDDDFGEFIRPLTSTAISQTGEDAKRDARELAEFKRLREEDRIAQQNILGLDSISGQSSGPSPGQHGKSLKDPNRKVIRRRITRTNLDGSQIVTFKFFVLPNDVEKILADNKKNKSKEFSSSKDDNVRDEDGKRRRKKSQKKHTAERYADLEPKMIGHSFFEDEGDNDNRFHKGKSERITLKVKRTTTTRVSKSKHASSGSNLGRTMPKVRKSLKSQHTSMHQKSTQEKKKRRRELEDKDLYSSKAKRKGTSNRRERGSARDRMPHVILADRFEQIRQVVEKRPNSQPFHKKVDKRAFPNYYEIISDPIDLQTIGIKNNPKYEYKTTDSFLADFELMKKNAAKFNGEKHHITKEANEIYKYVSNFISAHKETFLEMEHAVQVQMQSGLRKGKVSSSKMNENDKHHKASSNVSRSTGSETTANMVLDGINTAVPLGDVESYILSGNSDSEDSTS